MGDFSQYQRTDWCFGGGLLDYGISGTKRGCYFVGDQVQGEVEGGNRKNSTDRETPNRAPPSFGRWHQIERYQFMLDSLNFLGCDPEIKRTTIDFNFTGFNRLARL
jgi:hypothetical protein